MQLLLGTRNSATINLLAQLLLIAGLWVGFYLARSGQYRRHGNMQTTVVAANSFFILFVMITSFYNFVVLGGSTGGTVATLMMTHGLLGVVAELTGVYLILRMRTQIIPPRFRVGNFKLVMRSLLGLWTSIVLLGLGIYYFRYVAAPTISPVARLQASVDDLQIHADELKSSADRGNLTSSKRHSEHLINLIEGKSGPDYGDADRNGFVEDPGDGVGALNYLHQVESMQSGGTGTTEELRTQINQLLADAKAVIQSADLTSISVQVADISTLSQKFNASVSATENIPTLDNGITVSLKDFLFKPKTLTVKRGTTVTFLNLDSAKHTATEDNGKFDSRDLPMGKEFSFTFDTSGTFPYHCEYHGDKGGVDMAGTIVVE